MFWTTHILLGLIIGHLTGNYPVSIITSVILDIDHLWVFYKNNVLFSRKFFETITSDVDTLGEQRNILHNVFLFSVASFLLWYYDFKIFVPFFFAYSGHLLLDLLDNSESMFLYPLRLKTKGFIGYLSKAEAMIMAGLFAVFMMI
jgi:membrane-bound metal-dependent hydrolase YbcI (DUF457 family)